MSDENGEPCRGCGLPVALAGAWIKDGGGMWHWHCHRRATYRELSELWLAGHLAA